MPTGSTNFPGALDGFTTTRADTDLIGPDAVDHAAALNALEARVIREAPLNIEWPEFADLRVIGGISAGVDDWLPSFQAAQAALPPHVSGKGGGMIILPGEMGTPTNFYSVSGSIVLTSGQTFKGVGIHNPIIQADINGPVITSATDGGADPLNSYISLRDLYVRNPNAGTSARALLLNQLSHFTMVEVVGQAMGVGSDICLFNAVIVATVSDCLFGGAGASSCDHAMRVINNSNITRFINTSFIDARNGMYLQTQAGLVVSGCHIEALNSTVPAIGRGGLSMSSINGGVIVGNYFESMNHPGIVFYSGVNWNRGMLIGGNFLVNTGASAIDCAGLSHSHVQPNYILPGANAPNQNGVICTAAASVDNIIDPQYLASGSGVAVSQTAGGRQIDFSNSRITSQQAAVGDLVMMGKITGETWDRIRILADGTIQRGLGAANPSSGAIDKVGNGTPEGVVTAPVGSTFHRLDGGAGTCLYVKETGVGNTGWVAK